MKSPLRYETPLRHQAVITDRWGRTDTVIVNDGQRFSLPLRGNRFEGSSLDSLEPAGSLDNTVEPPDLNGGDLCSCTIEWSMRVRVVLPADGPLTTMLRARLILGDPTPSRVLDRLEVTLALDLPDGVLTMTRGTSDMEDALLKLQGSLPEGAHFLACITCAFSDYSPLGSSFIGSMACFRDSKEAYRTVTSKRELFDVWDGRTGFVQETFHCTEYEQRSPNTGYRG